MNHHQTVTLVQNIRRKVYVNNLTANVFSNQWSSNKWRPSPSTNLSFSPRWLEVEVCLSRGYEFYRSQHKKSKYHFTVHGIAWFTSATPIKLLSFGNCIVHLQYLRISQSLIVISTQLHYFSLSKKTKSKIIHGQTFQFAFFSCQWMYTSTKLSITYKVSNANIRVMSLNWATILQMCKERSLY